MKFGLGVPALMLYPPVMSRWEQDVKPNDILRIAKKADAVGFDYLTVPEHIVMPDEMVEIMGPRYPEGMAAAAFLAGATERIKLLNYVLVLPYRHPVLLAKQIAVVDFLSNGRMTLGTAAGHLEREFEILNVSYKERGAITDEYLAAIVELWTKDHPSFDGKYVQFDKIHFEPKPISKPYPPIYIGGNSKPAMRRAANIGDGWLPWLITSDKLPDALTYIKEQPGYGDPDRQFDVIMPLALLNVEDYSHRELGKTWAPRSKEEILERIGLIGEAGVTVTMVAPPKTPDVEKFLDWLDWFAEDVAPHAGDL